MLPVFSSLTSRKMKACGFVQSNFFTVPLIVMRWSLSYIAVEWCALAAPTMNSTVKVVRKVIDLQFMIASVRAAENIIGYSGAHHGRHRDMKIGFGLAFALAMAATVVGQTAPPQ